MPNGHARHGGRRRRRPPRRRAGLVASAALSACVLLAAGVTWAVHSPGRSARHGTGARGASAASPGSPAARLVLQVTPAPYQLPVAISRAVVLPGGATGSSAAGGTAAALLIAGGLTAQSATTAAVISLNPVTGQTSQAGRLAVATHDAAGAMLGSRPVVFGGGSQSSIAAVQAGPVQAGPAQAGPAQPGHAWSTAGTLPGVRSDLSAVTVAGKAYLIGGYDGASYDPNVLATSDGKRFTTAARLPVPVRYPAVAAVGTQIWVFGGQTPGGITNVIQRIDLSTGKAVVAGQLPAPLAYAAGFTLGGRIYVAGGQTAPAAGKSGTASPSATLTTSGDVLEYQPAPGGGQASGVTELAGHLPVPVANAAAAVTGDTGYLIGGSDGQRPVPAVTTFRLVPAASALPPVAIPDSAGTEAGTTATAAGGAATAVETSPILADAPWLAPAHGPGHLAPGSNPAALPGDILIADHRNNRLLIIDPQGRVRWQFPRPGDLARGQTFLVPDDAFFSADGKYIIATQEDNFVLSVISMATSKIVYRYGTPGVPGSGPDHLNNPDDALLAPGGHIVAADIKNCRIVTIAPPAHDVLHVLGQTTNMCLHNPPHRFGSPNGAFPMTNGKYLVTEINGAWVDQLSLTGQVSWSVHPPGVAYPSDTNEVYPGRYLTADYSTPGQVVEFNAQGRLLWRFGKLNSPSLALPLPNGDILVNDDFNDRVIVIDPVTNRIVWQYGHTGVAGSAPGYLHDPDGVDLTPPDSLLITHTATMGRP